MDIKITYELLAILSKILSRRKFEKFLKKHRISFTERYEVFYYYGREERKAWLKGPFKFKAFPLVEINSRLDRIRIHPKGIEYQVHRSHQGDLLTR